ncbi:hypothetical protein GCM10007881_31580 [Mesorhizobium huakuii]|nr:hypothetical protein GCM10007881_31580 [Mesorhizobium huakuii]
MDKKQIGNPCHQHEAKKHHAADRGHISGRFLKPWRTDRVGLIGSTKGRHDRQIKFGRIAFPDLLGEHSEAENEACNEHPHNEPVLALRRTPEGPALDIWDWFAQAPDLIGEAQRPREYEVPSAITAV